MYKQRCVGAEGPLMPAILEFSCGLVLYSAADAGVRALGWHPGWAFGIWAAVFVLAGLMIHRYSRVEIEYIWFSGQLIIRRHENGILTRIAVPQHAIYGFYDRKLGRIGGCIARRTRNCCATLYGRMTCTEIFYHDEAGRAYRLRIQPSNELRGLLWQAAKDVGLTEDKADIACHNHY
ncbi:MAG: hypothetical protein EOM63_02795 [Clostridia bacterium]|nr:hypothetical protein [Clostridia bacterium]